MPLHEVGLLRRMHADGDVGLAHGEVEIPVIEQQGHRDFRILLQEGLRAGGEPDGAEAHRRRHLQAPGRLFLAFREQRFGHRELGEDLAHRAVQRLALFGEDQAARMAVKERHLQGFLERGNLTGDGGLAEVQGITRVGEAARLRHRVENP